MHHCILKSLEDLGDVLEDLLEALRSRRMHECSQFSINGVQRPRLSDTLNLSQAGEIRREIRQGTGISLHYRAISASDVLELLPPGYLIRAL